MSDTLCANMAAIVPSERDPLLAPRDPAGSANPKRASRVGPMEISRSTRYGILAGIWAATFLSVCRLLSTDVTPLTENIIVSLSVIE